MIGLLKGMAITLKTMFRKPVTVQYPDEHLPLAARYMGFPGLLWDYKVDEAACVGCQVCARYCPTECMEVTMMDNPKYATGESKRKKMVDIFEIITERCILCGICVEVCNFEAISMTYEHEHAENSRGSLTVDLPVLLEWGKKWQKETGFEVGKSDIEKQEEREREQTE